MEGRRAGPSWWLLGAVLIYGPIALFLDGHARAPWPDQYAIGAVTLVVLWLASRSLPAGGRSTIWICVAVATGFEALGSQVWGGYHYRFGGIPAFVPFGHGLIYVFGIGLAATDVVRRYERPFTLAILAIAVAWAIGGLTLLPAATGRTDVHGVLWLPLFAYVLLFSPRRAFFAALFIATTDVELFGTWFGSWRWLGTDAVGERNFGQSAVGHRRRLCHHRRYRDDGRARAARRGCRRAGTASRPEPNVGAGFGLTEGHR